MEATPKSLRLHIGLFGRMNVGKSTFLNRLAGREAAITSAIPGTTTDPVETVMEFHQAGPVVFTDTAGLDDVSPLGLERRKRALAALARMEVVVLVVEPGIFGNPEREVLGLAAGKPVVFVVSKTDLKEPSAEFLAELRKVSPHVLLSGIDSDAAQIRREFEAVLVALHVKGYPDSPPELLGGILPGGGLAVLITPIDGGAPKGRLIQPQVQVLRAALDAHAAAVVVQPEESPALLKRLAAPPELVVCDSQVVERMVADTPPGIPCTTFSILFGRLKGDLVEMARAARRLDELQAGDRVLIAEACSHHPVEDDIGREKIPRWLREYTGKPLDIQVAAGRDWPADLPGYKVVIHCGGCMFNRMELISRMRAAQAAGVPVTNYGIAISRMKGVLERVLSPFPDALAAWRDG